MLIFIGLVLSVTAHANAACNDKLSVVLASAATIAKMPTDTPAEVRERERVLGNTSTLLNKAQKDINFCAELGPATAANTADIITSQQATWEIEELLGVLAAPDMFAVSTFVNDSECRKYARNIGTFILSRR